MCAFGFLATTIRQGSKSDMERLMIGSASFVHKNRTIGKGSLTCDLPTVFSLKIAPEAAISPPPQQQIAAEGDNHSVEGYFVVGKQHHDLPLSVYCVLNQNQFIPYPGYFFFKIASGCDHIS